MYDSLFHCWFLYDFLDLAKVCVMSGGTEIGLRCRAGLLCCVLFTAFDTRNASNHRTSMGTRPHSPNNDLLTPTRRPSYCSLLVASNKHQQWRTSSYTYCRTPRRGGEGRAGARPALLRARVWREVAGWGEGAAPSSAVCSLVLSSPRLASNKCCSGKNILFSLRCWPRTQRPSAAGA